MARFTDPYEAGRDYAAHGANEDNCHFSLFSTAEKTKQWERGRDQARNPIQECEICKYRDREPFFSAHECAPD